jgi:hypothetical protein
MRRAIASAGAAIALGCSTAPRTQAIVVVETDIGVPTPLASVRAVTPAGTHDFVLRSPSDVPFSFGLEPLGGDASRPLALVVEGRDAPGATLVTRSVSTSFRAGRTVLVRVRLEAACVGRTCVEGETCIAGACASDHVDPSTLPDIEPGQEIADGGREVDAGGVDAGPEDGGADTGVDASARDAGTGPPASCMDLRARPTGIYPIDPDGVGGMPAFDVFCENAMDGGGWTLIAKVGGMASALGYDAPQWTGPVSMAFGLPALAGPEEALLASYWTVPVTEVRIGLREMTMPARWQIGSLPGPTILRDAMAAPGTVPISGIDLAGWSALIAEPVTGGCPISTLGGRMVNARVRFGMVLAPTSPCDGSSTATVWIGVGAATDPAAMCNTYGNTSGGARLCGPIAGRHAHPALGIVFAR